MCYEPHPCSNCRKSVKCDDVIGLVVDDLACDVALTSHRVDGDDGAFDRHHVEQRRNSDNLIGFFRHRDLAPDQTLARGESRDHVDRLLRSLLSMGAARSLAVDGDHLGRGVGQSRRPSDEAAPERRRVERGENVAQMIMRRSSVLERSEAAQERQLSPYCNVSVDTDIEVGRKGVACTVGAVNALIVSLARWKAELYSPNAAGGRASLSAEARHGRRAFEDHSTLPAVRRRLLPSPDQHGAVRSHWRSVKITI